jgi:response regulator RpfG family c-di-GMP phosphodiesterase
MNSSIPICFYPMRKIILDDDQNFTKCISLLMHDKNFIAHCSPKEALHYLLNVYQPTLTKNNLTALNHTMENSRTHQIINIYIDELKHMLLSPRHQDINVLLVDYRMPGISGLEFLKEINHLPIKKALITGESDSSIAINAFNKGLVDAYLRKDEENFPAQIKNVVHELEWKYFTELSNFIPDMPEFDYLKNPHFTCFFKSFIEKNNIKSFCLSNMHGNFIVQDQYGQQKTLLVRNKQQLRILSTYAKEDGAAEHVIEKLQLNKVIPFFGNKEHWEIPANEWNYYLYPANKIATDPNVSWICVN